MSITAKIINGIQYRAVIHQKQKTVNLDTFDINNASSSCILRDGSNEIAISKWVSPKRTRSYPYARVYDTIKKNKRATVIPVVKDEGKDGDRDFLQWDTGSLMSLLDVFVILAYYDKADKNLSYSNKITNFKFNWEWVNRKLSEISSYYSTPLHWNLKELRNLSAVGDEQIKAYSELEKQLKINFHSLSGLHKFQENIKADLNTFIETSRNKAQQAQSREILTLHTGERLTSSTKSAITITNFVGGNYFFTVDEVIFSEYNIRLVESKHSSTKILPSKGDIKNGLLKMILYSNLEEVSAFNKTDLEVEPILKLTSPYIKESFNSKLPGLKDWCKSHALGKATENFLQELCQEANNNNFLVEFEKHG